MVRHQTSTDLQIKFHFYGGLIGGGPEVMGREVGTHGRDGKMVIRLFFTLQPCFTWFSSFKNMGGGQDPVE